MPKKQKQPTADIASLYKYLFYAILGVMWIKFNHGAALSIPLPIGFIFGVVFAMHEHFQIDRKIEYAILLLAMIIGFASPFGLYINF